MYKIMHRSEVIALADEENITEILNQALCPHCFVVGMHLYVWLDNRCVDMHRSHSRKLFKALRLRNSENTAEIISVGHGVSITDNWWIQRDDENLDYNALRKYNEYIADTALLGGSDSVDCRSHSCGIINFWEGHIFMDTSSRIVLCSIR